jgi:hypothetical protein
VIDVVHDDALGRLHDLAAARSLRPADPGSSGVFSLCPSAPLSIKETPKHEAVNPKQIVMTQTPMPKPAQGRHSVSVIRVWNFQFVSDFGFRYSSFLHYMVYRPPINVNNNVTTTQFFCCLLDLCVTEINGRPTRIVHRLHRSSQILHRLPATNY